MFFFFVFWSALIASGWVGGGGVEQKVLFCVVLFKVGGDRVSPRFHFFVFDVNQENKERGWVQHFLVWHRE